MSSPRTQRLPDRLWLLRHGQSAGNVASDAAELARLPMIDLAERDMDVRLSKLGEEQSVAVGRWFAQLPVGDRPAHMLCSP